MKKLKSLVAIVGCIALFGLSAGTASAQRGGGNFDPAQFRQMRMDAYKEQLEVTDDGEWKVLEAAIGKVMDSQQDVFTGMARGMMGGRRRGGNNGDQGGNAGGNRPPRNPFGGTPDPDSEALQAAIEAKAPAAELKTKMEKVRSAAKAKEAKLAAAQEDMTKLLSARQEAIAITIGLVK